MKIIFVILIFFFIFLSLSALDSSKLFGKDKIMHFTQSSLLTYWNYGFAKDYLLLKGKQSKIFAVSVSLSLGVGKEFSDKYLKKTFFSKYDLFYDVLGIGCGMVLINNLR
jgi:uncharacterized protein YfiM (DUF2279 family)